LTFEIKKFKNWIRNITRRGGELAVNNRIYVGNLSWSAVEEDLESFFSTAGTVTEAKLIRDRDTNKSRGFAFVTFADQASAEKAIQDLDGTDMMGRTVKVSMAEQRQREGGGRGAHRHESAGGGGGGRGYR
jgi:RNA recognition motif-containing protein